MSILDALDRANGVDPQEAWEKPGGVWERVRTAAVGGSAVSRRARSLSRRVSSWCSMMTGRCSSAWRSGSAGFVGAFSSIGQQEPIEFEHASRERRRRGARGEPLDGPPRPSVRLQSMVDEVNEVMADFDITWIECGSSDEANALKGDLWTEYKPEYNIL